VDTLLSILNAVAFPAFGAPVTVVELIGFVTGALCVWGVARQSLWNWPVGLLNNAAFGLLFLGAGLYADMALQVVFAAIGGYGWWTWARGGTDTADLPVRRATRREVGVLTGSALIGTAAVALLLRHGTDSTVPVWDSLVLTLSLVATYGQAEKILSSWFVWIGVDLISVPLYLSRGLVLTAVLYVGFTALCGMGLVGWTRSMRGARPDVVRPVPRAEAVA
jgi:nicotinamide mononucleotide transporter